MAPQFNLQEELGQIANPQDYIITNEVDATDDDALAAALEHAVEATAVTPENVLESEVLDEYRSLLNCSQLEKQTLAIVERLANVKVVRFYNVRHYLYLRHSSPGLQAEIEAAQRDIDADDHDSFPTHRQILDVYAFLIHWFVMAADKAGSKSSEDIVVASKPKVRRLSNMPFPLLAHRDC
ncbi:hypothetical protein FRC00_001869 [Tulasnella sp. 408]|nr:hypothetical protein FRC00_001869 [Tulasnella sp. 408]